MYQPNAKPIVNQSKAEIGKILSKLTNLFKRPPSLARQKQPGFYLKTGLAQLIIVKLFYRKKSKF